jgi:hypothetical protein
MALEATFRELLRQLKVVNDTLDALRCLLPDDPLNTEVALVQHLRESVEGLGGWLEDCRAQLQAALVRLREPVDLNQARIHLTACQTSFYEAERAFSAEFVPYEKLREIVMLGNRRKGVWLTWAKSVKNDIDVCRYEMDLTRKALTTCWQELAAHAGTTNISVQTTSIGPLITARRSDFGDQDVEGVT